MDHVIVLGENYLRRILRDCVALSLAKIPIFSKHWISLFAFYLFCKLDLTLG